MTATCTPGAAPVAREAAQDRIRRHLRALREEPGQAALEMALALPLVLTILFGMFQSSLLLETYCNATYACRNAARYASLHSSTSLAPSTSAQIQTMVQSQLFLNSSIRPTITVTYVNPSTFATSTNTIGNLVEVQVTWNQNFIVPFVKTSSVSVGTQTFKTIAR
jgi:Flp pilus assembly protein TadG